MINREKVHSLVNVFYQPEFKTFYVGDENNPSGVFVSLGMTTSKKILENITEAINMSGEYNAKIVEISSKKIEGRFVNEVNNDKNPEQYLLPEEEINAMMDREEAEKELNSLREKLNLKESLETLKEITPKASRLQYFIDKLNESHGWNAHRIQKEPNGNYRIYHLYVNYQKKDDIEYRIGIYVTEKSN